MVFGHLKHSQGELVGFDQHKDPLILKTQVEIESIMEERVMWFEVFLGRNLREISMVLSLPISHRSQPQQLECAACVLSIVPAMPTHRARTCGQACVHTCAHTRTPSHFIFTEES